MGKTYKDLKSYKTQQNKSNFNGNKRKMSPMLLDASKITGKNNGQLEPIQLDYSIEEQKKHGYTTYKTVQQLRKDKRRGRDKEKKIARKQIKKIIYD